MMRGELKELGEVVAGGEDQHWQDVTDESTLVITMVMGLMTMVMMMVAMMDQVMMMVMMVIRWRLVLTIALLLQ